eukprot:gene10823-16909_t
MAKSCSSTSIYGRALIFDDPANPGAKRPRTEGPRTEGPAGERPAKLVPIGIPCVASWEHLKPKLTSPALPRIPV